MGDVACPLCGLPESTEHFSVALLYLKFGIGLHVLTTFSLIVFELTTCDF